jgi:hypothetical protein
MTKRTKSQELGSRGESKVAHACIDFGWQGEKILNDFGEDLCFQTFLDEERDSHRIYVQVKSFTKKPKSLSIRTANAKNWICMMDIFYIFIYVEEEESIYWIPFEDIARPDLIFYGKSKYISIKSDCFLLCDERVFSFITWKARLEATQRLYLMTMGQYSMYRDRSQYKDLSIQYSIINLGCIYSFLEFAGIKFKREEPFGPASDAADFVLWHAEMVASGLPINDKSGEYFHELCNLIDLRFIELGVDLTLINEFIYYLRDASVVILMSIARNWLERRGISTDFIDDTITDTAVKPYIYGYKRD